MILLPILTIVCLIFLVIWLSGQRGKFSEKLVNNCLAELPEEYVAFSDVLFESNGKSTQIDQIVVSPYGVFVIETKGYKGWILGSENAEYWTQNIYGRKYRFYNPILQNGGHVRYLSYLLKDINVPRFIPIVVFDNRADIKVHLRDSVVVNRCQLKSAILSFHEKVISEDQQNEIVNLIRANAKDPSDRESQKAHKNYARNRKNESGMNIANGRCPRCGGTLVLRKGKYGSFYGCSNYPRCNFTQGR